MTPKTTFWQLKELAAFLQVSRLTAYRMAIAGKVPGYKVGNRWRFDPDEILAWLATQKNVGTAVGTPAAHHDKHGNVGVMSDTDAALDKIVRRALARRNGP